MTKLISGRVKKVPSANVSNVRYQFLRLEEAEPDLGVPIADGYVLKSTLAGVRYWQPEAGGNTSFSGNTNNVPEGSLNLYFTNARVGTYLAVTSVNQFADVDTSSVLPAAGNVLIWNGSAWVPGSAVADLANIANSVVSFTGLSTSNLTEGSNLYFTNARVAANIALTSINALSDVDTTGVTNGNVLVYSSGQWRPGTVTAAAAATNFANNSNVANIVLSLTGLTTSNLNEGSNLYYTNARVDSRIAVTNLNALFDVNFISPSAGEIIKWNGTQWVNSADLTGAGVGNADFANTASNANVALTVLSLSGLTTSNLNEGSNLYYTNARVYANLALTSIDVHSDVDTAGAMVGQLLQWNGTRWVPATVTASYAIFSGEANYANTVNTLSNFSTSNLAEGTNLYYTNARVRAGVSQGTISNLTVLSTIQVSGNINGNSIHLDRTGGVGGSLHAEGNVYGANLTTRGLLMVGGNVFIEDDIVFTQQGSRIVFKGEGINDYGNIRIYDKHSNGSSVFQFTVGDNNADVFEFETPNSDGLILNGNAVIHTGHFGQRINFSNGIVYYNNPNNFPNISLSPTGVQANTYGGLTSVAVITVDQWGRVTNATNVEVEAVTNYSNTSNVANIVLSLAGLTTSNLAEGTNLYYTNARVLSYLLSNVSTSNITEGSNLYYTNSRVYSNTLQLLNAPVTFYNNVTITGSLTVLQNVISESFRNFSVVDNMFFLNEAVRRNISNVVGDGANVVYTTTTAHGFQANDSVRITGVNPASYNQPNYTPIIAVTSNTFTIANTTTDAYVANGIAYAKISTNPDIGFTGEYNDGTNHHTGLFRDASDGKWKFFENYGPEPGNSIYINTSDLSYRLANVEAANYYGNILVDYVSNLVPTVRASVGAEDPTIIYNANTGGFRVDTTAFANANLQITINTISTTVSVIQYDLNNLSTTNVTEGSNLYYTNARVRSALTSGNNISYDNVAGNITLSPSGVSAGSYGSASLLPIITVDQFGRITNVSTTTVTASGASGNVATRQAAFAMALIFGR